MITMKNKITSSNIHQIEIDMFIFQCAETVRLWATVANEFDPEIDSASDSAEHADKWAVEQLVKAAPDLVVWACWAYAVSLKSQTTQNLEGLMGESAAAPDLLAALERAELSTAQIRMAANIGKNTMKRKISWYEGQLEKLGHEIRAAITKAKEVQREHKG